MSRHQQFDVDEGADLVEIVREESLPESIQPLLAEYETTVGDRDPYLWQWLAHLFPTFTLSCVDDGRRERTQEAKLLASLFVTTIDDLAERHGDEATFREATKIPFDHATADPNRAGVDADVIRYLESVWEAAEERLAESPRYEEFSDLLRFDLEQIVAAMTYAGLADDHLGIVSMDDLWRYDVHNMMICFYATVDLCNASAFDATELAGLRRVVAHAQRLARICNWLVTWERELEEGDPVSGVVVHALETGVVSFDQLRAVQADPTPETVEPVVDTIRDSHAETHFLERWHAEYDAAASHTDGVESVDLETYLEAFDPILDYHLESRGLL
ncbi:hypothetical protein [Natrarchaeobaculum aegyptiacum]|uniref:hypothetical protein n=1 Tax=Natrarchaeobaculum aegyptiacum TaxID=745377 RepID=UPI000A3D7EA9|nr:hypothetical protein [Natrarchaeobaculum aegyptiacum]